MDTLDVIPIVLLAACALAVLWSRLVRAVTGAAVVAFGAWLLAPPAYPVDAIAALLAGGALIAWAARGDGAEHAPRKDWTRSPRSRNERAWVRYWRLVPRRGERYMVRVGPGEWLDEGGGTQWYATGEIRRGRDGRYRGDFRAVVGNRERRGVLVHPDSIARDVYRADNGITGPHRTWTGWAEDIND